MNRMTRITLALTASSILTACVAEPEPTTFTLVNEGESEIYHDQQPGWLSLEVDGEPAMLNEPGCMKKCGTLQGPIACPAIAVYPTVVELQPGDTTELDWNGVYYRVNEKRNCYKEFRRGDEFEAQFCYGYDFEPIDGEEADRSGNRIGGATVKDPVCENQAFERGESVELQAE